MLSALFMSLSCPYCFTHQSCTSDSHCIVRSGRFWRKSDGKWIQRFLCLLCKKGFSSSTHHPCYWQNKRHKNLIIKKLLSGGMSQREIARVLGINRKTVVRKLLFWERMIKAKFDCLKSRYLEVEFDDLETFEHTKCKPLSVTLMVQAKTRLILGFEVSQMPSKGKLAAISRKKYGFRKDERAQGRRSLFLKLQNRIHPRALIRSDSNPHYVEDIKRYFPLATHETVKGQRGRSDAQGELKKVMWDPLFSLNHTCAMLRANINRLFRKTWCTTKRADRLKAHLFLYADKHNQRILEQITQK